MKEPPETSRSGTAEVIDFISYRNRCLIEILEAALADARAGVLTGAVLVLQRDWHNHSIVVAGDYERNPEKIIAISGEIFIHYQTRSPSRPTIID